jgi:hypothetical protein
VDATAASSPRLVTDGCDHEEVVIRDVPDPDAAPYGPVVQHGICADCESELERRLRADGWSPWRAVGD